MNTWPIVLGVGAAVGIAALASRSNAAANPLAGVPVQTRPLPAFEGLPAAQQSAIQSIAQRQLVALGYGPLPITGAGDAATQAAVASFRAAHPASDAQTTEYASVATDGRDVLYEIDDAARLASGQPIGVGPSSGLALNRYRRSAR